MKWLLLVSLFAIKLNEASTQTITWGKEFTATLNSPTLGQIIPGSINSKVYVIENPVNTNQVNTNEKHIVTSLRIFDGATKFIKEIILSELLAKKAKASPEKIYVADVVVWGNQLKVFYTVEQDKKSHAIFYVQSLSENGAAVDDPIKLSAVDITMGVFFGRGSIGSNRSMAYMSAQNFKYAISPDSSKFVHLEALLDPKIKKSKFYVHSFDKNFKLLQSKPVEIEVPGIVALLQNLKINDKGDIFILAKSPKSREELKEDKNGYDYSYQIHVSVSGSNNGQFRSKTLALAGNQYVTSAEMFIDKDNEVIVTGTYTNSDDKKRGMYHAGYFSGGFSGFSPDIKLKPFPTTDAFFDNLAATQKKDLRNAIVMIGKTFHPPVPKKIIPVPGEGHYVIAEVEAITVAKAYFEQELFSYDMVVYFINKNNEITWLKHIPKRQEFNAAGYGYCNMQNILSFQAYVDADNKLNVIYLDKKENDIPDATPVDMKVAKIEIRRNKYEAEGMAHMRYDLNGNRMKRSFYQWPVDGDEIVLSSAEMTMAGNKPIFLSYKLGNQKLVTINHSIYCLAELPR